MSHRKVGSRVPYARALYAAAVAALLTACSQSAVDSTPAALETAPAEKRIHLSETTPDLPEIVITASREAA